MTDSLPELPVLLVPATVTAEELALYVETGALPAGATTMSYADYTAMGRVADCDCQLIQCVCEQARLHDPLCFHRKSMTCAVPITCRHGFDVCPLCYPCSCPGLTLENA